MIVTTESKYLGFELSESLKGNDGFYGEHLGAIIGLLQMGGELFNEARAAHLVIDDPSDHAMKRLCKELDRWMIKEKMDCHHPLYFACKEVRPRDKQGHMHVLVIFPATGDCTHSLKTLRNRLGKLSNSNEVKLCKRRLDKLTQSIDQNTGETKVDGRGRSKRSGSANYHDLKTEFNDAVERYSYLAKVFSKGLQQKRGESYSHSRLNGELRPNDNISQKPNEDVEAKAPSKKWDF